MELTPYSKDGLRPLSRFHAEEMLYEYAQGSLDPLRTQALEEYLKTDSELQTELVRIRKGLGYLEGLTDFRASAESLDRIRASTSFSDRVVEKLRMDDWPPGLKLGLESIAVVSVIFVIAIAVPWNSLFEVIQDETGSVTLAEIRREFKGSAPETSNDTLMELVKGVVFDDEGVPESAFPSPQKTVDQLANVPQMAVNPPANTAPAKTDLKATTPATKTGEKPETDKVIGRTASSEAPAIVQVPPTTPQATLPAPPVVVAAQPSAGGPGPSAAAAPTTATEADPPAMDAPVAPTSAIATATATGKAAKPAAPHDPILYQGYLYRGQLKVTNVVATTPKLVEFITTLGGRKAGQVPVGWQKGQGSYFHFTIPEAKYEELETFFREYGTLVIAKERHERIMPEGIIRLIIEVEEKNAAQ